MYNDEIFNELGEEIANGKGCIVFDFGCYFPYSNQDILIFNFKLGELNLQPYKHNHRYPNNSYVTISKKMGKKVSKLGYPVFVELDKEQCIMIEIELGIKDNTLHLIFPVNVNLTKDKPSCAITLHFNFKEMTFKFFSLCKCKDGGWQRRVWTSDKTNEGKNIFVMDSPTQPENSSTFIYHDILTPFPQALEDLMIL